MKNSRADASAANFLFGHQEFISHNYRFIDAVNDIFIYTRISAREREVNRVIVYGSSTVVNYISRRALPRGFALQNAKYRILLRASNEEIQFSKQTIGFQFYFPIEIIFSEFNYYKNDSANINHGLLRYSPGSRINGAQIDQRLIIVMPRVDMYN